MLRVSSSIDHTAMRAASHELGWIEVPDGYRKGLMEMVGDSKQSPAVARPKQG
jgi:hypothetical protein